VRWLPLLAVAACGDNLPPAGAFEIVGHADLGARGMNAALAVVGDTVYVGSRTDLQPVLIVDVADPANPQVVGQIGPPDEGLAGLSSRELRAVPDLNLLVVLNLQCDPSLHGCGAAAEGETLKLYDITNRRAPVLAGTYPVHGSLHLPQSPHEFYLWRDPKNAAHVVLALTAIPGAPTLELVDVSTPSAPVLVTAWDSVQDGGLPTGNNLHSVMLSDDGKTAWLSHQPGALVAVDISGPPALITPPAAALAWPPFGTHSAVKVPGRDVLVTTQEIYAMPYGTGCPWGNMRTVDIHDPKAPAVLGEYKLPENDPSTCAHVQPDVAFTAHNATVTHDLALVTWYAGGLQAVDISDPAHPAQLAELRPDPLPSVTKEDPALGGNPVEMWTYPVIQDGLVYVVDVRNGLYVLRYHGRWAEELATKHFAEGNSNVH
jgi:hypothetical protein